MSRLRRRGSREGSSSGQKTFRTRQDVVGSGGVVVRGGTRRRCQPRLACSLLVVPSPEPEVERMFAASNPASRFPCPPAPLERNPRAPQASGELFLVGLVTTSFSPISILSRIKASKLVISATCFLLTLCYSTYLDYQKEYF